MSIFYYFIRKTHTVIGAVKPTFQLQIIVWETHASEFHLIFAVSLNTETNELSQVSYRLCRINNFYGRRYDYYLEQLCI